PGALAEAGGARPRAALPADLRPLERALARSRPETSASRSGPQGRRRRDSVRRRLRPVGLGGLWRAVRLGPAAHGRRGSRRGDPAPALPLVAARLSWRGLPHRHLRSHRWRRRRSRGVGRRNDPHGSHPRAGPLRRPRMCRRRRPHRPDTQPARGRRRLSIMAGYTDFVLFRRLLGLARPYWPHVVALFLLSLLSSPLALLAPLPLKIAVDSVIGSRPLPRLAEPLVPDALRSPAALLAVAVGLMMVIALLGQLQALVSTLQRAYIKEKLVLNFRRRLFRHVQRLSLAYHDARGASDSTYRIQHDATAVEYVLIEGVIPFVSATVTL